MARPRSSLMLWCCLFPAAAGAAAAPFQIPGDLKPPPGTWHTSWVGNSFGGDGGPNGQGYWVQDGADEIEVTPDGTVIAGVEWDEAGRCLGLYKDGKPNRQLLKENDGHGKETAWGWGTANSAVAVWADHIYAANTGKKLERFAWKPGDIESAHFVDEVDTKEKAIGLNARDQTIAVVYPGSVELRRASDLAVTGSFNVADARDAAVAPDGSLCVIAGRTVHHFTADGKDLGQPITAASDPTAVALDNRGRLLICDDGPDQQVKTYQVQGAPRLVATFGIKGGLQAGVPGADAPTKLFALRGAGTDAAGNLYLAMCYGGGVSGNLVLRSFTPTGQLRWELHNHAFVDTFGFDPAADGTVVYGRTAAFDLNLNRAQPGSEWKLAGITLDPFRAPVDPRLKSGMTAYLRHPQGRRLLACIGQYGGGYNLYTFDEPRGYTAHPAGKVGEPGRETWAWDITENGDIWQGDAAGDRIVRHRFKGWSADGKPQYETAESWPRPDDFQLVRRVFYQPETDSLYLFGYLKGQKIDSWGVVGCTARRYNGWLDGKPAVAWTNPTLPMNPKGSDQGESLSGQGVTVTGDYIFLGMVKPDDGKQYTHILRASDGTYVGSFSPGPEVGGNAGWQDMPYSVAALRRKNGEYLVLAEEDWRGKNLLYRWTPAP